MPQTARTPPQGVRIAEARHRGGTTQTFDKGVESLAAARDAFGTAAEVYSPTWGGHVEN